MDQYHQSLQLTDAEEKWIKKLGLKKKVKNIMESNEDIDVKRILVKNLIEEARLKEKDRKKQWYINNRDERLTKTREYQQEHRDEILGYKKKYRQDNRDKVSEYQKQYYQDHRDDMIAMYNKNRQQAIEMLGGKCIATGATEKLNFCHREPSGKLFEPNNSLNNVNFFNNQKNIDELNKCSLLCNAAHKAYDKTWLSLGYTQNEETFPIWLDSYKDWHNNHRDDMTYRAYLINNPIMEITE